VIKSDDLLSNEPRGKMKLMKPQVRREVDLKGGLSLTFHPKNSRRTDPWRFPYWLKEQLEGKEFSAEVIYQLGKDKVKKLLQRYMEDKWPPFMKEIDRKKCLEKVSSCIVKTCKIIKERERTWYRGLKKRLSEKGIDFKVEGENLCDVPVDVHVVKVYSIMMGIFEKRKFLALLARYSKFR